MSEDEEEGGVYYEKVAKSSRKVTPESLAESGCQTDDLEQFIRAQAEAEARKKEEEARRKQEMARAKSLDMATISTEGEETDPKFVVRPKSMEVLEGEVLKLECEVEGTHPLGELAPHGQTHEG